MNKIPPVRAVQPSIKQTVKKVLKPQPNLSNLDLSFEETGFYRFGNKLVKIKFPR